MEINRISHKKLRCIHKVPLYYKNDTNISSKVCDIKVYEIWKYNIDGDFYYRNRYKDKFINSLSVRFGHKKKNISVDFVQKNFEFEGNILTLVFTKSFYLECSDEQVRDFNINNLLESI